MACVLHRAKDGVGIRYAGKKGSFVFGAELTESSGALSNPACFDGSNSPYWFLRTLSLANLWFAAEAQMGRPDIARAERNQQIKRMYGEKASFREIAEQVHCSMATVHDAVKAIKKDSAGL